MINLISNSIKYTAQGFVRIEVTDNEDTLSFAVIDSGVGIEPDKIDGLFIAFTKIARNRDMNKEGVGLGLTISKNLAKALGGDILVESVTGLGSKFTLVVPNK